MRSIALSLATLGPLGYLKPPGTIATAVTVMGVYGFTMMCSSLSAYVLVTLGMIGLSYSVITFALRAISNARHDPSEIVIDEVVGTMVVFIGIPATISNFILGFILFRLFDITKCGPIKMVEKLPAAWGILADDLLAGLMAHYVLWLII